MVNFLQYILAGLASFQNTGISPSFFSLGHLFEKLWKKRNERLDLFTKEMWERKGRVREWTEIEAKEAVLWLDILKFPLLVSTTKLVFVRSLSLFSFFFSFSASALFFSLLCWRRWRATTRPTTRRHDWRDWRLQSRKGYVTTLRTLNLTWVPECC